MEEFFLLLFISFFCELVDSSLGMGYGTLLTPTLLLMGYHPLEIIPTILLSELITGFVAAYSHNQIKNVDFKFRGKHLNIALILIVGSTLGILGGVALMMSFNERVIKVIIGAIVMLSGIFVIFLRNKQIVYRNWKMILLSITAAFNKSISGGGYGPLITSGQILGGVEGKSAVGITCLAEAFTCLVAVIIFEIQGKTLAYSLLGPIMAGALLSIPLSVTFVSRFKENRLKIIIGLMTLILGGVTMYKNL